MTSNLSGEDPTSNPSGSDKKSGTSHQLRRQQLRAASVGWNFVTSPLVGGGLGYGVDWLISSYPWGMVVGFILGFISAFIELMRIAR
ncbi:MAG: hypothetical protein HOC91_16645 [Nitrospinaceae bacterium]|jgi:ATP synthase protein I|nr:hypothetical protein [Nitrospinaceae bacterium]MBT3432807.1 hypothetical protein [Nitrospinaceae bacterium]MBT3822271.1 hypothetical protein [Nitrospinaceae bacterium]MBT4093874.1 hypothetical protein [Nitrospinaceae bacterium]MBT4432140.1 hypothetical protein [Nitrospinaceae bacterium]